MRSRTTRQKLAILDELRRTAAHPTAAELYDLVRRRVPRVSLGTVYRVLQEAARDARVLRIETGGAPARFDGDTSAHFHVRCPVCGAVSDTPSPHLPDLLGAFQAVSEHRLTALRLELDGICPRCRKAGGTR